MNMEIEASHFKKFIFISLLSLVIFTSLTFNSVQAQEQAGVSISPALIEETLNPGEEKDYEVTIKNLNEAEQVFYLSIVDIADVDSKGAPVFALPGTEPSGLELSNWVALPTNEIKLGPGVSERVTFKLKVPSEATCSHFGGLMVSVEPPDITQSGAAIGYKVANILSLRVAGDCREEANIRQFSTKRFFHGAKDVDFEVRIENTGNTLVRPTGPLEIFNMLGQKVDTITFNDSQGAVFPKRVRQYEFNWTSGGTGFGRYEAILSPVYGDEGARMTMSSTAVFWILPLHIIGPALAALAILLLVTFIGVKLYIRRTLAHMTHGQTRIVRQRRQKGVSATLLLVMVMLTVTALFMIVLLAVFA